MRIEADDEFAVQRIQSIAREVVRGGGFIHPDLTVHQRGPDLWVCFPRNPTPGADAPVVLAVPNDLFVPVTDLRWHPSSEGLEYSGSTHDWSPAQQQILQDFVALFNGLGKVRQVGTAYARHSVDDDPELFALIRRARPMWRAADDDAAQKRWAGEWHPEDTWSPAHSVISSRLTTGKREGGQSEVGYYMPMLDFFNHHPFGAPYRQDQQGRWIVRAHHPSDTDQIFLRYNRADAFGIALGLGYAENATRHVASVASVFDVQAVGQIRLQGVALAPQRIPAPRVLETRRGLLIGGLVFQLGDYGSLRTLLGMPLRARDPEVPGAVIEQRATALLDAAVAVNLDYFRRLEELCSGSATDSADQSDYATTSHGAGLRGVLAQVARHQQTLLRAFLDEA